MMLDFERVWKDAASFRKVAPEVRLLLHDCYGELVVADPDSRRVTQSLNALLLFLSSAAGRTDANCCVTDYFFAAIEKWSAGWQRLPVDLQQIISDLGGTLHDSVYAEPVARTFDSLPEQLLERLRRASEGS